MARQAFHLTKNNKKLTQLNVLRDVFFFFQILGTFDLQYLKHSTLYQHLMTKHRFMMQISLSIALATSNAKDS